MYLKQVVQVETTNFNIEDPTAAFIDTKKKVFWSQHFFKQYTGSTLELQKNKKNYFLFYVELLTAIPLDSMNTPRLLK